MVKLEKTAIKITESAPLTLFCLYSKGDAIMFIPKLIVFEEKALNYPKGKALQKFFEEKSIPIHYQKTTRVTLKGDAPTKYQQGKNTLVIGVRKMSEFQTCKPSAHYQLPLVSGCMGMCEYCYLNTQMGKRPYIKIYANSEEIFAKADEYIEARLPEITIFEGAATSDPLALEPYTHVIEDAILHFAKTKQGRFRFVSKYTDVDSLLTLEHNSHTEIRLSLNIESIIKAYEHRTSSLNKRLAALKQLAESGYPTGIIIAPVFWNKENKPEYKALIEQIGNLLGNYPITFEIISHRYTTAAKNNILEIFPDTLLPMDENDRTFKFGQFGYGKYVYPKETLAEYKEFFSQELSKYFDEKQILYII